MGTCRRCDYIFPGVGNLCPKCIEDDVNGPFEKVKAVLGLLLIAFLVYCYLNWDKFDSDKNKDKDKSKKKTQVEMLSPPSESSPRQVHLWAHEA